MTGLGQVGALGRLGAPALARGGWWLSESQLDLDFANNRAFNRSTGFNGSPNGILTYTSPSPKMVYGDDGVLGYAPHNLLTYSEQFDNAAWAKYDVTVSADAIAAPNGSVTADQIVESATTALHRASTAIFTLAAVPYTFSIRVKMNLTRRLYVNADAVMGVRSLFDLSAGTVVSTLAGSATIADIGNDYWLITVTGTGTGASSRIYLQINRTSSGSAANDSYEGDGVSGIYVWGAQLSRGATPFDYIPTTSAAVYSLPIDHDPITFDPLGVLIEEQRTNLLTYSEQFDNAAWTKTNTTVTANAAVAPDGTTTADKIVENTATGEHSAYLSVSLTSGTVYTFSVYLKKGERTYAAVQLYDSVTRYGVFNLDAGTQGSSSNITSSSIVDIGGGWYRCSITFTGSFTGTCYPYVFLLASGTYAGYTGDGTSGLYAWGAQLEAGAFPTSYIPTVASQVTRAADQVSILTSAFGYVNDGYTLYSEMTGIEPGFYSYQSGFQQNSGLTDGAWFTTNTSAGANARVRSGNTDVANFNPAPSVSLASGFVKQVLAVATNDFAYSRSGSTPATDGTGAVPSGITKLGLMLYLSGKFHIKRLTYFPTRKTNAELQALTA